MNNNDLKSFIREKINTATPTSKIARIRILYDEIEQALASGFTMSWMAEQLTEGGVAVSGNALAAYISQIRRAKNTENKKLKISPKDPEPARHENESGLGVQEQMPKTIRGASRHTPNLASYKNRIKDKRNNKK